VNAFCPGLVVAALFCITPGISTAEMTGHDTAGHSAHSHDQQSQPATQAAPILTEPGQGAFAALSEIVRVLEADPETDWSKVDLTALRDHLVDMDVLVRNAVVAQSVLSNGVRSVVTGNTEVLATASRMVPAHAAQLRHDSRWTVETTSGPEQVVLTVTSDDPATVARIKALGFYGLMASQDHHREHHYIIATGGDAHGGH